MKQHSTFVWVMIVFTTYAIRGVGFAIGYVLCGHWYDAAAIAYGVHLLDAPFLYNKFRALA